ncbi:nitric oxide associated protein 1 [Coemansia spiralis]|uniref:Nitric oxide associated protein 1 n=2 Tax=Coemansia TaxID=4863 RepID=A0A9W8GA33_9FUNG|nr:nitric oxide associated protein 1 [Coemansia spiralis]
MCVRRLAPKRSGRALGMALGTPTHRSVGHFHLCQGNQNSAFRCQARSYVVTKRAAKVKAPQCPTCGAAFQTVQSGAPGYLNETKWRLINQANLVQGLPMLESAHAEGSVPTIPALSERNNEKGLDSGFQELSEKEYEQLVNKIDDPELKAVFTGEALSRFADPKNVEAKKADKEIDAEEEISSLLKSEPYDALTAARLRRRMEDGRDRIICQRCYTLKHYSRIDHPWKDDIVSDPRSLHFLRYKTNLLVVVVCDIFDIPGSLIPHLGQFIGERHPVILVANKTDMLPKDFHEQRVKMWLRRFTKDLDLNVRSLHLVSSRKNIGVRELAADILEHRRAGQDIYMVGRANVGKSELINALLRISVGGSAHRVLASHVPGTTMGLSGVPLRYFAKALVPAEGAKPQDRQSSLYDTPGVFSRKSIVAFLNNEELKMAICNKRITPFSFILGLGRSVMLGGLARIDLIEGPMRVFVTIFSNIRPHFTNIERAYELIKEMESGKSTILQPPIGTSDRLKMFPKQKLAVEYSFEGLHKNHATLDVAISGIGWIAITGKFPQAKIRVYTPHGAGVYVRPPLMPFEYKKIAPHSAVNRKTPK